MNKLKSYIKLSSEGLLNSYGQLFFSNNKYFSVLLLLASFIDVQVGLSGLISVIIIQLLAVTLGYAKEHIESGTYTFNGLMVGMAIGIYYEANFSYFLLLTIAAILCFFISLWILNIVSKNALPLLSWPFIIVVWAILLGASNFSAFELKSRHIYSIDSSLFNQEGLIGQLENLINGVGIPDMLTIYFKSLGAILFQYNIVAGILVFIGLLCFSRIATTLSFIGFATGFFFYRYFEGDFSQLIYSYIGFNFILTSIALGGFFIVPSKKSYLLVVAIVPIIAITISALHSLFSFFSLPLYSFPFCAIVSLVILALRMRVNSKGLEFVSVQQYSLEKNHYKSVLFGERFSSNTIIHIGLPIIGEWRVSQGYNGNVTHKGDWAEALDFDVVDEDNMTYKSPGINVSDFYCYDLPVIAPADGWIIEVLDGIEDNKIGDVNLENNWGNTIVIKHSEFLFSKLTHFKRDTFKHKVGDYVQKGDVLGVVGNSGRSPEPHLHFQLQSTPYIGSKTLSHPIAHYISKHNGETKFESFSIPKEGEIVSNIQVESLLKNAFDFKPGQKLKWKDESTNKIHEWEVYADALNNTYITCSESDSFAYFVNNGTLFYFTDYVGNKSCLLYEFYLSAHKVLLGYYDEVELNDAVLIDGFFNPLLKFTQDIFAPFFHFCKVKYSMKFKNIDDAHGASKIELQSSINSKVLNKNTQSIHFDITINKNGIESININQKNTIVCIYE